MGTTVLAGRTLFEVNTSGNPEIDLFAGILDVVSTQPPFRRRRLGRKLARMRTSANMTLDVAAQALFKTRSALHRIEKGETLVDVHLVKSMMDLYDCFDPDLVGETVQARERGWWIALGVESLGYIDVEAEASEIREVSVVVVPGLLQTSEYARALFEAHPLRRTKRARETDVRARRIRQQRLTDAQNLLRLDAIIDESALRKAVGGAEVMREQVVHIHRMAELRNVTVRVLLDERGAHGSMNGGFTLLNFPDPADPAVLYVEHPFGSLHMEKEKLAIEAKVAFGHLANQALSPEESVALLERMLAE
ncbi:helix-turn-helix transcriptional regulator [Actinosynnema sp. NPDC023587]|uniref:helix-turn-helix domain-containing protein n=1 Tax=Actinosynnema sp. NPDC023587 TaxID=3154695 RepID=UPI0033CE4928